MYSTCLFCARDLGRNDVLETFPIGRRLAFDMAKGRLWAVCPSCERWNLTPLDERWEAIERAEALYRDTRRRLSTEHVGLARLPGGTELVRIGEPLRPEFAGWRYGDQFGRRRRRQMLIAGAGIAALSSVVIGSAVMGASLAGFGLVIARGGRRIITGSPKSVVARIRITHGDIVQVRRRHLSESSLSQGTDGALAVTLRYSGGSAVLEGPDATRVASIIVPQLNRYGGDRRAVAEAVARLEQNGGPAEFLSALGERGRVLTEVRTSKRLSRRVPSVPSGLFALQPVDRLALEMALHEETERRALDGQLADLERAWRDAEEIAAIADDLFVPDGVRERMEALRGT